MDDKRQSATKSNAWKYWYYDAFAWLSKGKTTHNNQQQQQ